jgi:hypothetical protein
MWWWFDGYQALSATIHDVTFTPPPSCYVDDEVPTDVCLDEGVCAASAGYCDPFDGIWACNHPEEFEAEELTCDGLDNDCDGLVDEAFVKLGLTCDGPDDDKKKNGIFVCDEDGTSLFCDEDGCAGKECGDGCGECGTDKECVNNQCVDADDPNEGIEEPVYDCNGITEIGQCDGNWLMYCAGGELVEQYCAGCCGLDAGKGYYDCLPMDQCTQEECVPQCDGKWCGPDGCGGICGICDDGESCSEDGECVESDDNGEDKQGNLLCGDCPTGTLCNAVGECVPTDSVRPAGATDNSGAQGCTAAFAGTHSTSASILLLLVLFGLLGLARRQSLSL